MTDKLKKNINKAVNRSVRKYKKTYKALEKYDNGKKKKTKLMADRENLRSFFQSI